MCIELETGDMIIMILLTIIISLCVATIKLALALDDRNAKIKTLENKVHRLEHSNKHYRKKLTKFINIMNKKF